MYAPPVIDLVGQKYGRLSVVLRVPGNLRGSSTWECLCECGAVKITSSNMLRTGHAKSCGCLNLDSQRATHTKHGLVNSPTYTAWKDMKRRCLNSKSNNFHCYGGRGISVCQRWMSFENFLSDMGERPNKTLSLERIDNNGNYEPGNCKWATLAEQNRNTRRNRWLVIGERKLTVSEWSREFGITASAMRRRGKTQCLPT